MIDGSVLQSAQRCFEKKSRVVVKMVVNRREEFDEFSPINEFKAIELWFSIVLHVFYGATAMSTPWKIEAISWSSRWIIIWEKLSTAFTANESANANGKIPRDHEFPAIFHFCRLPLAIFNTKTPVLAFVNIAFVTLLWWGEQCIKLIHGKTLLSKMSRKPLAEHFTLWTWNNELDFSSTILNFLYPLEILQLLFFSISDSFCMSEG